MGTRPGGGAIRGFRAALGALAAIALAWALPSSAQTVPSLDARTWAPSADPNASLVLEPPSTPGPWRWNVSAWLEYAHEPVVLSGTSREPVAHQLGADLVASLGVGTRLAFGVDLPVFVWQDGTTGLVPTLVTGGAVPTSGIGDVSLRAKATLVSDDRMGTHLGFGLAALGDVTLPTGNQSSFMGEGDVTGSLRLLAAYTLGPASARASFGYAARADSRVWPAPTPCTILDNMLCQPNPGPTFGGSIPWAIALTLQPKAVAPWIDSGDRQTWELGAHGAWPLGGGSPSFGTWTEALTPALLALDDRVALGHYHDAYVLAGAEVGLDRAVGVPTLRGLLGIGWAPRSHDKDDDGVDDDDDQCPELAEDRDGIQDSDGCPEDDADDDGVPDTEDACPLVRGVPSPVRAQNGCPPPPGGAK